jgi:hypothetical protein
VKRLNLDELDPSDLVSIGHVARYLGLSDSRLRQLDRAGRLTPDTRTPGGQRRYRVSSVRAFSSCDPVPNPSGR